MSLLFAERPLVINTQLAMKIGLNEAIVLQQLHYWLRDTNSGMECDGVRWIYNTTEQWLEQFPFWSESTLKRAFASLKTLGLLRCEKLNKSKRDMTNFYTINYGSELLDDGKLSESIGSKCAAPSGQNDTMEEVKMKRSIGSKRPNVIGSKWPDDPTENTTEITDIRQVETTARYLGTALYWIAASINIKPGHDYYFYIRSVNTVGKSAFVEAVGRASDDAEGYLDFFKGQITESHLGKELLEKVDLYKAQ